MKPTVYPGLNDKLVQDQIEAAVAAAQELAEHGVMFLAIPLLHSDDLRWLGPLQEVQIKRLESLLEDAP